MALEKLIHESVTYTICMDFFSPQWYNSLLTGLTGHVFLLAFLEQMAYRYENVTKDENQISHRLPKLYANTLKKKKYTRNTIHKTRWRSNLNSETLTTKPLGNTPITDLSHRGTKCQVHASEPVLVDALLHNYLTKSSWQL